MSRPLFTVVIPTIGRPTLARTLDSIDLRMCEIIVVADTHGPLQNDVRAWCSAFRDRWLPMNPRVSYLELDAGQHDTGSPQLHMGFHRASGHFILNCGDDDVYEPDAFSLLVETVSAYGDWPLIFKAELHPAPHRGNREPVVLWDRQEIAEGHVTGQGFVCPNDPQRMGRWVNDWTFMRETVALHGGRVEWREELIARCY